MNRQEPSTATLPRRFRPYPEYKDSGAPFLGDVPEHWEVRRLGQIGNLTKGNGGSKEDEAVTGVPCVRYGDLYTTHTNFIRESRSFVPPAKAEGYTPIAFGDVLFAASGETIDEIGKSAVNLMDSEACCGGDVILFRPRREVNARFMGYAADCRAAAAQKATMGRGITVMHVYGDALKCLMLALPPIPEQTIIAAFLDRETAKIDTLIARKERLLELLQERRTALIARAVTKGLDPNVIMEDSGVEWLGEIPAHWTVLPLKRLWRRCDYGVSESLAGTGAVRVLTMAHIQDGEVILPEQGSIDDVPANLLLDQHDLLFNRTNSRDLVGKVGLFRGAREDRVSFASYLVRLTANHRASPAYLNLLLNSRLVLAHARSMALLSVNQANLNPSRYGEIRVPLPGIDEQVRIVRWVHAHLASLRDLQERVRHGMALLREYRTALISAAVTGKIDVREEAA